MTNESEGAANVAMIKAGYKAFDEGATDVVLENWHPNVAYYGFDGAGQPRVFHGIGELFAMLGEVAAKMDVFTNELLAVEPVGPEMVTLQRAPDVSLLPRRARDCAIRPKSRAHVTEAQRPSEIGWRRSLVSW